MIKRDLDGIKHWAIELGAGDLYALLACILSAKPWKVLSEGLTKAQDNSSKKRDESDMKSYAKQYLPEIAAILGRVPREMLLILKTNDLLRGLETSLGTRGQRTSLITMSSYCVRSIHREKRKQSNRFLNRCLIHASEQYNLMKLYLYQLCLKVSAFWYGVCYL
jgi:aarF domain-containing kinase